MLDIACRRSADGTPEFVQAPKPTDEALQALQALQAVLHKFFIRTSVSSNQHPPSSSMTENFVESLRITLHSDGV